MLHLHSCHLYIANEKAVRDDHGADTQVNEFDVNTGASSIDVFVPASTGHIDGSINAGASSIEVTVPDDVAARIDNDSVADYGELC